jgi:hypothetical protein
MRAEEDIALIWSTSSPHMRRQSDDGRCILIRRGGNPVFVAISKMSEAEFSIELGYAKARKSRKNRAQRGKQRK